MRKPSLLLSAAVYPALIGGSLWAALAALSSGLSAGVTVLAVNVAATAAVIALERWLPYRQAWRRPRGDVKTDALHLVGTSVVAEVTRALVFATLTPASIRLSAALGVGLWPARWPVLAELALALLVAELGSYWSHRVMHERRALWRIHAVHHSAPRLYWLNSLRNHPIDALLTVLCTLGPLVLLGVGPRVITLTMVFWGVHGMLQHSNIDVRLGPLNWVFSMAEVHRFHHSRRLEEANANYGQVLLVWDVLFGTRYLPASREPPVDVGLADHPGFPEDYLGQVASPFSRALWRGRGPR